MNISCRCGAGDRSIRSKVYALIKAVAIDRHALGRTAGPRRFLSIEN